MTTGKLRIGIVGAGIAGLTAGIPLQQAGHHVRIFESRMRTGGRIQSLPVNGIILESGPEFIHGNLKETIGLLRKYQIPFESINGKMYSAVRGRLDLSYDMTAGWDKLLIKMKSLEADLPFREFLLKYFPGDRFKQLRKSATGFAEGFDLADPQQASTKALEAEWALEDSAQYRIPSGYGTLVNALENEFRLSGGEIFPGQAVQQVDWSSQEILVSVEGARVIPVDKLIVSLPLGILQGSAPQHEQVFFLPSLGDKQTAFRQIGFGTVIKIAMIWTSAFWKNMAPDAQFIFSDCFIPTWWTQYPMDLPMLTGWLGGPAATRFAEEPDSFFLDKSLESLSSIFSIPEESLKNSLKDFRIFNWKKEQWSRGAYSYSLVGSTAAKRICRTPVDGRIYFAGEACYEGPYPGTVEAAVVSGMDTARQLLSAVT